MTDNLTVVRAVYSGLSLAKAALNSTLYGAFKAGWETRQIRSAYCRKRLPFHSRYFWWSSGMCSTMVLYCPLRPLRRRWEAMRFIPIRLFVTFSRIMEDIAEYWRHSMKTNNGDERKVLNSIIKFDLHIHSKASEYKESVGIVDQSTKENLNVLLSNLDQNKVSLFSITDHNRFEVESKSDFENILKEIGLNTILIASQRKGESPWHF